MAERTIRYWNVLVGTHLRTWHDPLLPVPWKSYRGETYHPPFRVYSPGRLNYSKSGLGLGLHGQSRLAGFSPFFKDKINWCFNTAYRSRRVGIAMRNHQVLFLIQVLGYHILPFFLLACSPRVPTSTTHYPSLYFQILGIAKGSHSAAAVPPTQTHTFTLEELSSLWLWPFFCG